MPEGIRRQIHIAVALVAAGILVAGQIHVVANYARLFAAVPIDFPLVVEGHAITVKVRVDIQHLSTAGLVNRRRGTPRLAAGDCPGKRNRKPPPGQKQGILDAGGNGRSAQPGESTLSNSGILRGSASGSAGRFSQTLKCSTMKRKTSVATATIPRLTAISVHAGK